MVNKDKKFHGFMIAKDNAILEFFIIPQKRWGKWFEINHDLKKVSKPTLIELEQETREFTNKNPEFKKSLKTAIFIEVLFNPEMDETRWIPVKQVSNE